MTADTEHAADATDERILDATIAVLARGGLAGVSMRAVAREADVAVGLANYHFDNKTALICAALRRIGEKDMELVTPPDSGSPTEQLLVCLRKSFDPSVLDTTYLSLRLQLWSLAGVDPDYGEINRAAQRSYLSALAALIEAARPELDRREIERRAVDVLVEQNGVWLTAILIPDQTAIDRAVSRCESIALDSDRRDPSRGPSDGSSH